MAYNKINKHKRILFILELYKKIKQDDIPDTYIVEKEFPKHGIWISYSNWQKIKSMKPSELYTKKPDPNQTKLFD